MKNLPTIAGVIGIALIITSPLTAQAPSGSSTTPAGSSSSASPSASASESSAAPAANATNPTSADASAPVAATAGSSAQAPSTVARPAVPTTSPVAPVTATTSTVTPAADVRATTQDPQTGLTRPPTQNTTVTPGSVSDTASADAARRDGGTSRRILGPGSSIDSDASATASANDALTSVPPVGVSSTATVAYLRAVEPSQRNAALDRVEAQLADTNRAINRLPNSAPSAPAAAQVDYAAAIQEVQAREAQLRSSLMTAQQSDEAGWAEARNRLAADYDAYIAATHRARAAAVNLDPTVAPAE